jgi:hypothetical protein
MSTAVPALVEFDPGARKGLASLMGIYLEN